MPLTPPPGPDAWGAPDPAPLPALTPPLTQTPGVPPGPAPLPALAPPPGPDAWGGPDPAPLPAVTEFSKKTGDFPSLSPADLQVLALTYELQAETGGVAHLRAEPQHQVWGVGWGGVGSGAERCPRAGHRPTPG